ncbi:MAG: hypothetical protein M3255_04045 [Pseudomonadota bacterium]|nr:hypothetical protein [Pseudomonadota bacterium]
MGGVEPVVTSPDRPIAADLRDGLDSVLFEPALSIVIGQLAWAVKDRQTGVCVTVYPQLSLDVVTAIPIRWDLPRDPVEAHAVVMVHGAFILLAEDVVQSAPDPRHEGRTLLQRRLLELGVEGGAIDFLQIAIGRLQCLDADRRQLLE